ncbi:helix-turn-helix domain-containing protein [Crocosphaera chwakensis]|uniref:Transcriptional Regulator, XRE family protein n=1 Tax=Crocosphaera chwakensis CCY0110 TaxID=391612 RepID=A3IVX8_9CHRO|nr:helix-turn-helix transcriptional regulator [Crocosphaera chwakensis]EAZ89364.1 Transcriptional Regulator, XRE family protein [Crocosphaera chwakensis CCY0110]
MKNQKVKIRRYQEAEVVNFGKRLKEARMADGRSVQVLATMAGISLGYWYQLEKEDREWISEEVLRSIESVLDTDFGAQFSYDKQEVS